MKVISLNEVVVLDPFLDRLHHFLGSRALQIQTLALPTLQVVIARPFLLLELCSRLLYKLLAVVRLEHLDFLAHFFEHLEHTALFKDLSCQGEVVFGFVRVVQDDVKRADDFVRFSQVRRPLTIQLQFKFLHTSLYKSRLPPPV